MNYFAPPPTNWVLLLRSGLDSFDESLSNRTGENEGLIVQLQEKNLYVVRPYGRLELRPVWMLSRRFFAERLCGDSFY